MPIDLLLYVLPPSQHSARLGVFLAFQIIIFIPLLEENQWEGGTMAQRVFINMWKYTRKSASWNVLQVKRKDNFQTEEWTWIIPCVWGRQVR